MHLTNFDWLADENIHPEWIEACRSFVNIYSLADFKLLGASDTAIIRFANKNNLIIITQDSDFGKLAFSEKESFIGIVYLRPGHFNYKIHLETINHLLSIELNLKPPFLVVAIHSNNTIKVRVRNEI